MSLLTTTTWRWGKGSQLERGREGGSFIASSTRSSLARAHECECMSSIGPSRTMPWRFRSRSIKGRTQYSYAYVFAGKKSQQSTQIFVSKLLKRSGLTLHGRRIVCSYPFHLSPHFPHSCIPSSPPKLVFTVPFLLSSLRGKREEEEGGGS